MNTPKKILKVLKGSFLRLLSIPYVVVTSVLYVVICAFFLAFMCVFAVAEWIFTGDNEISIKIFVFWLYDLRDKLISIFFEIVKK